MPRAQLDPALLERISRVDDAHLPTIDLHAIADILTASVRDGTAADLIASGRAMVEQGLFSITPVRQATVSVLAVADGWTPAETTGVRRLLGDPLPLAVATWLRHEQRRLLPGERRLTGPTRTRCGAMLADLTITSRQRLTNDLVSVLSGARSLMPGVPRSEDQEMAGACLAWIGALPHAGTDG